MKHGCFPLRSVRLLVFFCGVFLLYANPAKADPIHLSQISSITTLQKQTLGCSGS